MRTLHQIYVYDMELDPDCLVCQEWFIKGLIWPWLGGWTS